MDDIVVMPKPDWVSWDDIHELLLAAHKKNIEKGIVMNTVTFSGDKIKEYLGKDGRCYVAFCGDKLVGTTSVRIDMGKKWYNKGLKIAKEGLTAVLKKYQGLGIVGEMNKCRDKYLDEIGVEALVGDTAEDNTIIRKLVADNGYKEVRYFPAAHQNHNSVEFVKWLNGCPFSDKYIQRKFSISKRLTKLQYKPGKVERSRFLSVFCNLVRRLFTI